MIRHHIHQNDFEAPTTENFRGMDSGHLSTIWVEPEGSHPQSKVCVHVCDMGVCPDYQSNHSLKDQGLESYPTDTKGPVSRTYYDNCGVQSKACYMSNLKVVLLSVLHRPNAAS